VILAHIFMFVPGVLVIGMSIGFVIGGRAARDAIAVQQRNEREREERRKKRAEAAQAAQAATKVPSAADEKAPG
jgi:hypothetical protein